MVIAGAEVNTAFGTDLVDGEVLGVVEVVGRTLKIGNFLVGKMYALSNTE